VDKKRQIREKMGLYDAIHVFMKCPYCGHNQSFDAQTKDLGKLMFSYHALSLGWKSETFGKKFRKKLQVFPCFPRDKNHKLWKNQAEKIEAAATVPEELKKLKYVNVTAGCHSIECRFDADRRDILDQGCPSGFGRLFEGKIKIKNGKLVEPIYDIKKDRLTEKKLSTYKKKHKKIFDELIKKYKHEPIICRNWNENILKKKYKKDDKHTKVSFNILNEVDQNGDQKNGCASIDQL